MSFIWIKKLKHLDDELCEICVGTDFSFSFLIQAASFFYCLGIPKIVWCYEYMLCVRKGRLFKKITAGLIF